MPNQNISLNLSHSSRPEAFLTRTSCKVRAAALRLARQISGKILDVGCGNGLFLLELWATSPQAPQAWGIDFDRRAIREAQQLFRDNSFTGGRFIVGDAFRLPFPDNNFAAVFCLNTLINIAPFERVENLLSEIYRVCCPGGLILFDYRNAYNPYLACQYCYNKLTHRLTTEGHRARQFAHLKQKLNITERQRIPISSPLPGIPLGYLNIWEK